MNECDFCLAESEHLIPINDGAWAICSACNDVVHIQMNVINKSAAGEGIWKEEKLCGHGVPYADCSCVEEEE